MLTSGLLQLAEGQASQVAGWLKNEGTVFVATRKTEAADELSKVGTAIRQAAEKLNESDRSGLGQYAESAADGMERAARYLEKSNFDDLVQDAARVARRNPSLFLGGVFLAGLAAGRFVKAANTASPRRSHR
jgi:hypothetical protein